MKDIDKFISEFKDRIDNRDLPEYLFYLSKQKSLKVDKTYVHIDESYRIPDYISNINIGLATSGAYIPINHIEPEAVYEFMYNDYTIQWQLRYRGVAYLIYDSYIPEYGYNIRDTFEVDEYEVRDMDTAVKLITYKFNCELEELRKQWD